MMKSEALLEMAVIERQIGEEIAKRHPHYFREDNHAAWTACKAAELRAEALEHLAKIYAAD
jgi:hypothetical protein